MSVVIEDLDRTKGEQAFSSLLEAIQNGDPTARDRLWSEVYVRLRKMADYILGSAGPKTLSPTCLVHEAYCKLKGKETSVRDREHFIALALRAMRQAKIQYYRARQAQKRQEPQQANLEHAPDRVNLIALDDALRKLDVVHPRLARVVEARYFAGFSREDAAQALDISVATCDRDWLRARTYLKRLMNGT